ncbi:MAG: hypothetical protein GW858_06450 [Sphingomonadales bacterium]|nr:hypothetical protein [Sphingomonadales bacterium]NCQ21207.1 hypothetical protein [Sphingomonadales bacterium]NCT03980.1 hypothetical protein [Sphingomonadales bacterium]
MALSIAAALAAVLPVPIPSALWARTRVTLTYFWRHGRLPRINTPVRFTEWVQWRKLRDRDHSLAMMTDKLFAKTCAIETIGQDHVIPTLWQGDTLPRQAPWPRPFIVKANHGCNQYVVVRNDADWHTALRRAPRWLQKPYGGWLDEWHYTHARRVLLVEPFVGTVDGLPVDYKVYVFGGIAQCVQMHIGRGTDHRWAQFDRQWQRLSSNRVEGCFDRPVTLSGMLAAAEAFAGQRDFLRVDFYEVEGVMLFGEACLFPGSGLDPFSPDSLDFELGQHWRRSSTPLTAGADAARTRPKMLKRRHPKPLADVRP